MGKQISGFGGFAMARWGLVVMAAVALDAMVLTMASQSVGAPYGQEASASNGVQSLDFEFFKTRVEPIFLKKRPGFTRCYVCHSGDGHQQKTTFRLMKLSPGSSFWTEEQSRANLEIVSRLVVPGDPSSSRLLIHPLAPEAGGDPFHKGGRQFASPDDPDWQTIAEWVRGQKADDSSGKVGPSR
jgi:hypothetical protein